MRAGWPLDIHRCIRTIIGTVVAETRMHEKLNRSIDVWKREGGSLICYRCFEVVGESLYWVQSKDFIHFPMDESHLKTHQRNFLELLVEEAPDEPTSTFATLEEAILRYEAAVGDLEGEVRDLLHRSDDT